MEIFLDHGHTKIRHPVKNTYKTNQAMIERLVGRYNIYKAEGNLDTYLRAIGFRLKLNDYLHEIEASEENSSVDGE